MWHARFAFIPAALPPVREDPLANVYVHVDMLSTICAHGMHTLPGQPMDGRIPQQRGCVHFHTLLEAVACGAILAIIKRRKKVLQHRDKNGALPVLTDRDAIPSAVGRVNVCRRRHLQSCV
jgi:hypothetical protein